MGLFSVERAGFVVTTLSIVLVLYALSRIVFEYVFRCRRLGAEPGAVLAAFTSEVIGLAVVVGLAVLVQWILRLSALFPRTAAGAWGLLAADVAVAAIVGVVGSYLYHRLAHPRLWRWFVPRGGREWWS